MTTDAGAPTDSTLNYAFLLSGVAAIIFGLLMLFRTDAALSLLFLLVGLWWLIQGVFYLLSVFVDRTEWGWKLFAGVLGVVAGVLVLQHPWGASVVIPSVVALFLGGIGVVIGLASIVGAFRGGGFAAGLFGVISVLIGLAILFNSAFTGQVLVFLFAILLLIDGVIAVYLAIRYR